MDLNLSIPDKIIPKFIAKRFAKTTSKKSIQELIQRIAGYSSSGGVPYERYIWMHNMHVWVYRCTNVISSAGVRAEPKQYREYYHNRILKREELPNEHPAVQILVNPNPNETGEDIREQIWISLCLTGMFFLAIEEEINRMQHLRSDRVTIVPDPKEYIGGYIYQVHGSQITWKKENVIFGKYYNPNHDYIGLAPMMPAANSIQSHLKATYWNLGFFDNSAMPLGLLTTQYNFANDKEYLKTIKDEWQELYGGYTKFGSVAVVGGGLDYKPITPTHSEMAFTDLLDKARDEIFGAFGVPKIFANAKEAENYSNLKEYEKMLWRHTMIPKLIKLQGWFNKYLNPRYAEKGERIITLFDLTQVEALREDIHKEADASRILVLSGQRTINEARDKRGETPLIGGDVTLIPMSFIPLENAGDVLNPKEPKVIPPSKRLKASKDGQEFDSILKTSETRFNHWMITKDIVLNNERLMIRGLSALFTDWHEHVQRELDRLKIAKGVDTKDVPRFDVESVMWDVESAKDMLDRLGSPIFEDTMNKGGTRVMATIGVEVAFDLTDPRVMEILSQRTQRFVEHIAESNWDAMKASLQEGLNNSETMRELSERVTADMGRSITNAPTIARTETLPCYHEGQMEGMRQSGVVERKEWMSAFTDTSRDGHMDADSQKTDLDGFFVVSDDEGNTDYLQYPGDPSGTASNIINCLCDVLPVIEIEE